MSDPSAEAKRAWAALMLGYARRADDAAAPLRKRLAGAADRIKQLASPPDLVADWRAANAALGGGSLDLANELLDGLDARLASAGRAAEAAATIAAAAPGKGGAVAFAKIRLAWRAAQASYDTAAANLRAVGAAMLEHEDLRDDPQLPELRAAVARLADRMPELDMGLTDILDDMIEAAEPRRGKLRAEALRVIDGMLAALDADPIFREFQDMPSGAMPIYDKVAGSLRSLKAELGA